jgi:hypothetical protein
MNADEEVFGQMRAEVIAVKPGSFFAVQTSGGITVVENPSGCDVQVGDVIRGNFETLGGESMYNETQLEEMDVFVQDFHCSRQVVRQTYGM